MRCKNEPITIILLIAIGLSSCNSKRAHTHLYDIKPAQIRHVIGKSGLIRLPLAFDANHPLKNKYNVDKNGNDSLIFDGDIKEIIGFLPDTAGYYAFLFHTTGDMEYPTIMTLDKRGNKIDRQIICTAGCAGHATMDVFSCYDSVWIGTDLKIRAVSKVIGAVETEESAPQVLSICNVKELHGFIDRNGKISIEESGLINCSKEILDKIFRHAPTIDLSKIKFDFSTISENTNHLVDSVSFISMYQVDTLINKSSYGFESPVYIVGKVNRANYDLLIAVRHYGTWFKTIDMLSYDQNGLLKGFIFLAAYGGDSDHVFDSSGYFDKNIYYSIDVSKDVEGEPDEAKLVNCIRTHKKYLIDEAGTVSLIKTKKEKFDCGKKD